MSIFSTTKLTYVGKKHIKSDIYSFSFRPLKKLPHTAGQHGFLSVTGAKTPKPFSLASAPNDNEVMIATHVHPGSRYKQALDMLQPGDAVKMRGPIFNFTLNKAGAQVVFLAQGIGITPFRSLLRHASLEDIDVNTTLIHVEKADHIFKNETQKLATQAYYPDNAKDFIKTLQQVIREQPKATYYISGAFSFLHAVTKQLKKAGIASSHIRKDSFIGYK